MAATRRTVLVVLLAGILVPFAHSTPDRGEAAPSAPIEPYIELTCPSDPFSRGTQPTILLHAVNPTGCEAEFNVSRSLEKGRRVVSVYVKTAGTSLRLSPWYEYALNNPPLSGGCLYSPVGSVSPGSREEIIVRDLDLFDPASLEPGTYRLPYELSYSLSIQLPDGLWLHNINRNSYGILAFTVSD